jgi:hypothetical protein
MSESYPIWGKIKYKRISNLLPLTCRHFGVRMQITKISISGNDAKSVIFRKVIDGIYDIAEYTTRLISGQIVAGKY